MSAKRALATKWSPADWVLLQTIADHLGVSMAEVLRWALRYYAAHGHWTASREERQDTLRAAEEAGSTLRPGEVRL